MLVLSHRIFLFLLSTIARHVLFCPTLRIVINNYCLVSAPTSWLTSVDLCLSLSARSPTVAHTVLLSSVPGPPPPWPLLGHLSLSDSPDAI